MRIIQDKAFFYDFIQNFSIQYTEMFRDPMVYVTIREKVVPHLRTYSKINIWHAGCATGEEVYSLAILLHEEELLEKCTIYATDINQTALNKANKGFFNQMKLKEYSKNYYLAQGKNRFVDYFEKKEQSWAIRNYIKKNITFAYHNMVADGEFAEMNVIMCRNAIIYFDDEFQKRSVETFYKSLSFLGFLVIGDKESLPKETEQYFETICSKNRVYQKII